MAQFSAPSHWHRAQITVAATLVIVVVLAAIYLAAEIFIPFTLAVFFSFLLSPLVSYLQRHGLGRVPSVILVTTLTALLIAGLTLMVGRQISGLVDELPGYTPNIQAKVRALREAGLWSGAGRFEQMYEDITSELSTRREPGRDRGATVTTAVSDREPAVVVHGETPQWVTYLVSLIPSVLGFVAQAGLTLVLVIFILLKREDVRNRFIRLVGEGNLSVTTRAVDEAADRVSRFLLMQLAINTVFGVTLTIGLWLLDVRYAVLWGVFAAAMRYIPYLGTWLGLIVPVTLSLFTAPGWAQPLLVFGLYMTLELLCNNLLEPWLYGSTVGVSEVALLIMAAVWAFLWGPIGLMLSIPLTVCLVVLGKYVPQLKVLDVLLGDSPPLDPDVTYYQRLLAHDEDEAAEIVQAFIAGGQREQVYDELLVPALCYAKRDLERDQISDEDEQFVLQTTRSVLADLTSEEESAEPSPDAEPRVLGLATRDEFDQAALELFRQCLGLPAAEMEIAPADMLAGEQVNLVGQKQPAIVCVVSLPPGGLSHARYLCKRLRARYPEAHILVGRWGVKARRELNEEKLREAGADQVGMTMLESRTQIRAWLPVAEAEPESETAAKA